MLLVRAAATAAYFYYTASESRCYRHARTNHMALTKPARVGLVTCGKAGREIGPTLSPQSVAADRRS